MIFTFDLILLIFTYIQNNKEKVEINNKIYHKNYIVCKYIKQKNLYNLSKLNKLFYLVYKFWIDRCIYCNTPCITIQNVLNKCCDNNLCKINSNNSNNNNNNNNNKRLKIK